MSDYASIIGGSGNVPIPDAPPDASVEYFVNSGDDWDVDMGALDDTWSGSNGTGDHSVFGGTGDDSMASGSGDDVISGQDGDDTISTDGGNDIASGGDGDDVIDVDGGDSNTASGGAGNDAIVGGGGADFLAGGEDDDAISGGGGNDMLFGQSGDDTVDGGEGNDMLFGQGGDDSLTGGGGNDQMWGGDGDDVFFFDSNFGNDVIKDFADGDSILLTNDINGSGIATPDDVASLVSGTDTQTVITFANGNTITIDGVGKDDFLTNIADYVKVQ
jgi:Ca2+-binding RTX toxin-like protein